MIKKITNFDELEEYIKSSEFGFRDAVLDYYKQLGGKLGFTIRRDSSIIRHSINLGKVDLVWVEPNVAFFCEFGKFEDVLKCLWKSMELKPELIVLLLSSGSSCKPKWVAKLLEESEIIERMKDKFLVLDIKGKTIVRS